MGCGGMCDFEAIKLLSIVKNIIVAQEGVLVNIFLQS